MFQSRRTPTGEYTTSSSGCYGTLTIVVFPLAFYLFQVLGLVSPLATILTGVLVLIRVVVEWSYHNRPIPNQRVSHRPVRPTYPARVVAEGCYLCGQLHHPGLPYHLSDGYQAHICERCKACLSFSEQLTNPAMRLQQAGMHIAQSGICSHAHTYRPYAMNQR